MEFIKTVLTFIQSLIESLAWNGWYKNKYRSQVKALHNPYTTCFSHCVCWLLQNVSDKFQHLNPDDVTVEINDYYYQQWTGENLGKTVLHKFKGNLNQLWDVQRHYIQNKLDKEGINKTAQFKTITNTNVLKTIIKSSPIVVSTAPKYKGKRLGHVMMIVDYKNDYKEDEWVIDDPFGDFRVRYKSGHVNKGNDLKEEVEEFEKIRTGFCLYVL